MPAVSDGETVEVGPIPEGYKVRIKDNPVFIGHNRSETVNRNVVEYPPGLYSMDHFRGESVHVHAASGDAEIQWDPEGFGMVPRFLDWIGVSEEQSRGNLPVDISASAIGNVPIDINSVGVSTVPISIDAQSLAELDINLASVGLTTVPVALEADNVGGIDFNLTGSSITQDVDITAQTVGDITQQTARIPAEGKEEVNADITQTVSAGSSQSSTVTADANEVWEVESLYIAWEPTGIDDGPRVTVESEAQGVELASAEADGTEKVFYRSGGWDTNNNTNPSTYARGSGNVAGTRIDDTNGLKVIAENVDPDDDITEDVTIRWAFRRIRA